MFAAAKKSINSENNLQKLLNYCAYQERCWQEVKAKMNQLGIASGEKDAIIHYLIEHNYVDELRYASAVTRGKFNQRKWGRLKIMFELRGKQVPETLIKQAFDTDISARNYELAIQELYLQKIKEYPDASPLIRKDKAIKFLLGKGYEYPIVEQTIKAMGDTQLTIY